MARVEVEDDIDLLKGSKKMMAAMLMRRIQQNNPSLGGNVAQALAMGLMGYYERSDVAKALESSLEATRGAMRGLDQPTLPTEPMLTPKEQKAEGAPVSGKPTGPITVGKYPPAETETTAAPRSSVARLLMPDSTTPPVTRDRLPASPPGMGDATSVLAGADSYTTPSRMTAPTVDRETAFGPPVPQERSAGLAAALLGMPPPLPGGVDSSMLTPPEQRGVPPAGMPEGFDLSMFTPPPQRGGPPPGPMPGGPPPAQSMPGPGSAMAMPSPQGGTLEPSPMDRGPVYPPPPENGWQGGAPPQQQPPMSEEWQRLQDYQRSQGRPPQAPPSQEQMRPRLDPSQGPQSLAAPEQSPLASAQGLQAIQAAMPQQGTPQRESGRVAPGYNVPRSEVVDYIQRSAAERGIDPNIALRVAQSEGLNNWRSTASRGNIREPSYGPFQLLQGGPGTGYPRGLGNEAPFDVTDPATWRQNVDFALDKAREQGWRPWYGAAKVGITGRQGISEEGGIQQASYAPPGPRQEAPQPAPYQVAQMGGQPPGPPQQAPQRPQMTREMQMLRDMMENPRLDERTRMEASQALRTMLLNPEKPTIVWQEGAEGRKIPYMVDARTGTIRQLPIQGQPAPEQRDPRIPERPAGVSQKEWDKEIAQEAAKRSMGTTMPAELAGRLAMYRGAKEGFEKTKNVLTGEWDAKKKAQYIAYQSGVGGFASGEVGTALNNTQAVIQAGVYAGTGTAAPESEIRRLMSLYAPTPFDSPELRKQKIEQLDNYLKEFERIATQGRSLPSAPSSGGGWSIRRMGQELTR